VLHLQADGVDPARFLLSAWAQRADSSRGPLERSDHPRTLPEVVERLEELLTAVVSEGGQGLGDLVVEFVVPRSLLTHPFDQWRIGERTGFPRRLGIEYRVVVRSSDRLRARVMHARWRQKWDWLAGPGQAAGAEAVLWARAAGDKDHEALLAELIGDDSPLCLALSFPPTTHQPATPDELTVGLYAGTPIMLWCRDDRGHSRFASEMAELLAERRLMELPDLVLGLRRDAVRRGRTEGHLGLHLTLLWDNPERIADDHDFLGAPR
jgi:hypothetical protein